MRNILSWVLFCAVLIAGAAGWIMFLKQKEATVAAQRLLASYDSFRQDSASLTPARFIRADGLTVSFGLPAQVQRGDQTFVDYEEHVGTLIEPSVVFRVSGGPVDLAQLVPGTELRMDIIPHPEDPSRYTINAIYILD